MDLFGASRNPMMHEVAMEVFGNPVKTKRPDLCERYLWALSQLENSPGIVANGMCQLKLCHSSNKSHTSYPMTYVCLLLGTVFNNKNCLLIYSRFESFQK